MGDADTATYTTSRGFDLSIEFTGGTFDPVSGNQRRMAFDFVCNKTATKPTIWFVSEDPIIHYNFLFVTDVICSSVDPFVMCDQCNTLDAPYCLVSPSGNVTCKQCRNDCDCDIGQYCSRDATNDSYGNCATFNKVGAPCVPMTSNELADATIPDKYKCADIVRSGDGSAIVSVDGPHLSSNLDATCVDSVCMACPVSNDNRVLCGNGGLKATRSCINGKYVPSNINNNNNKSNKFMTVY